MQAPCIIQSYVENFCILKAFFEFYARVLIEYLMDQN